MSLLLFFITSNMFNYMLTGGCAYAAELRLVICSCCSFACVVQVANKK